MFSIRKRKHKKLLFKINLLIVCFICIAKCRTILLKSIILTKKLWTKEKNKRELLLSKNNILAFISKNLLFVSTM